MFEVVRQLADRKKPPDIYVKNDDCVTVDSDVKKAEILKDYFEKQYNNEEEALDAFDVPPRPLRLPISSIEVGRARNKLKNGRATGPDEIPNELL